MGRARLPLKCARNSRRGRGFRSAPGFDVEGWLGLLRTTIGATDVTELLLASDGTVTASCDGSCSLVEATLAHIRWPDGIADGSGIDREPAMLDYLAAHPLP